MLLTVPEAARRVGKDPETVRRWIRSGRLRSEKVGTQHLVREEDLAHMVEGSHLDVPAHWAVGPAWESLVRDGRSSH